jgi:hypothetical protein
MGAKHPDRKQVGTQIDVELYRQVRSLALLQGRKAGEVIDDAIRLYLAAQNVTGQSVSKRNKAPVGSRSKE